MIAEITTGGISPNIFEWHHWGKVMQLILRCNSKTIFYKGKKNIEV